LDENKTDDPRGWLMNPGVVAALCAWRDMHLDAEERNHVFLDEYGRGLTDQHLYGPLPRLPRNGWRRPPAALRAQRQAPANPSARHQGHVRDGGPGERPERDVGCRPDRPPVECPDRDLPARSPAGCGCPAR